MTGGAVTACEPAQRAGRYDQALRRRSQRRGRETGCWVYIPGEALAAAKMNAPSAPPYYRLWADPKRPRVVVNLYREP